jgi:D-cysteine desulfhydrase
VLHAPRAGLEPGAILFPQPPSATAAENLRVVLGHCTAVVDLPHWSFLPFGMARVARRARSSGERATVMVPGGATPHGALGYVSAALELAQQVARGELPRPETVVIGVGSTCTSAGLLVGFHHAARLGIGFVDASGRPAPPRLVSVRVTPWPVTSAWRIVALAVRASRLLADLAGDPALALERATLAAQLEVDGRFLGRGYGHATRAGLEAIDLFGAIDGFALDTTYSGKSAASLIARARTGRGGPMLFWSTKSTVPLPPVADAALERASPRMRRFLERA